MLFFDNDKVLGQVKETDMIGVRGSPMGYIDNTNQWSNINAFSEAVRPPKTNPRITVIRCKLYDDQIIPKV